MPDIRLQDYVTKIKDLIHTDRHDEAIAHCQHILRHYPKHIETYGLLGEACLEKGLFREAIEFFQRTLSADPENFIARVGLGIIYDEQGALPGAIWQMERAFELEPGNTEVRRELQRLYAQRDGAEKARLKLTRGALGRLYNRNGLYERAIVEFHAVLRQDPDLPDIRVALVEALWREGRRLEAVETCLELLDVLPYCLKANLILGEIWTLGGHEDAGEEKLQMAQALDPENRVAQEMMGKESPLPAQEVTIPELEAVPESLDLVPQGEEPPAKWEPAETGLAVVAGEGLAGEWEETGELPDWLKEMGIAAEEDVLPEPAGTGPQEEGAPSEEEMPDWLQELMGEEVAPLGQAAVPAPEEPEREFPEEVPDWLREMEEEAREPGVPEPGVPESAVPEEEGFELIEEGEVDWLQELEVAEAGPPVVEEEAVAAPGDEVPESLQALVDAGILDESDIASAMAEMSEEELEAQRAEEVPDWLDDLAVAGARKAGPEIEAEEEGELEAEDLPEWLRAMRPQEVEESPTTWVTEEEMEGLPDWLREVGEAEREPSPAAREEPPGLEDQDVPEWLQDLRAADAGPEGELEAAVEEEAGPEVEAEAEEVPEWLKELGEPAGEEAPAAEAMAPPLEAAAPDLEAVPEVEEAEELPDWLRDLHAPEAEEVPELEEAEPVVGFAPGPEAGPQVLEEEVVAAPGEEVPESLRALVEAGILDESDLASAMAEMSEEDLAAQRAEEVPDWLRDLMGEEEAPAAEEVAPILEEEVAEPVAVEPEVEEKVPEWLKELGEPAFEEPEVVAEVAPEEEDEAAWLRELETAEAEEAAPLLEEMVPGAKDVGPQAEEEGEEVPDWLHELMGEDVPAVDVTRAQAVDEALGPPEEEDLPDWLREWEEAEAAEASAGVVEEVSIAEVAPEPVAEVEEVIVEAIVETEDEEAVEEPEVKVPVAEPVSEAEEEPLPEPEPEEAEEHREAPALEEMVMEAPEAGLVAEEEAEPLEVIAVLPAAEAAPPSEMEMVAPYDRVEVEEELPAERQIESLVQQLKANPRDYPQRLDLARLYREGRDWSAALTHYQKLISARKFLPAVLDDLREMLQEDVEQARVYQLMGDAYMQQDDLDKALEMYRLAQQALIKQ